MNDKDLIKLAHKRFEECEDAEADNRKLFEEDLKFANGDSDNGWQWSEEITRSRSGKPCLTINKVKQHNRQIINEARQNKPTIKIYPVDDNADKETAEILNGIIRHIESNSDADTAYDTASEFAVDAGLGYWRVTTDYVDDESRDQDIFIKRVKNPLNIYLDPHIQEADGSDARYAFVHEDISKEEFESRHPDVKMKESWGKDFKGWLSKDTVRLCEYYYVDEKKDTIFYTDEGVFKKSELDAESLAMLKDSVAYSRDVKTRTIKWCLLAGDEILERNEWLGKYIPIVRVVGDEQVIDGKTVRSGHTRSMKDSQRMYNYWSSSATEFVALQGKQPYLSPVEAVAGLESYWDNANDENMAYLPYNSKDVNGEVIPMPQRQQPPVMADAYIKGMQLASDEMKAVSGQYDAQFGKNANQQSGRALGILQEKGETATFHFIDNKARAIKYTGKILIDLIPKIYDTERVVRILGEDGKDDSAEINPNLPQASMKVRDEAGEIKNIYNPGIGKYDVIVAVGASYGTKRREAFEALTEMSSRNPQLMQIAGDIIMKAADFPMAEELAERLKKTIPPELQDKEEGEEPQIPPQIQQQLQQSEQMIKQLDETIQAMNQELESKDAEKQKLMLDAQAQQAKLEIDRYNAETNRMKVAPTDNATPQEVDPLQKEIEQRKSILDLQITENKVKESELNLKRLENDIMTPEMQLLNQSMSQLAQSMGQVYQALQQVSELSKLAAAPRRSTLEFDDNGLPISSLSQPVIEQE